VGTTGATNAFGVPVSVTDLGSLGAGRGGSSAWAISDNGQVVGGSGPLGGEHAFSWTAAGGMVDVGDLGEGGAQATAVNNNGQVVGYAPVRLAGGNVSPARAFSWTPAAGMIDLGGFGADYSYPEAINDNGQVVGWAYDAVGRQRAFSWTDGGGMVDLGGFGCDHGPCAAAYAVNNRGQVVGYAETQRGADITSIDPHAFSWTPEGGMVDLTPALRHGGTAIAYAVNDNGEVAIWNDGQVAVWTAARGLVNLGFRGTPNAISGTGQVVGVTDPVPGVPRAFSWTPEGGLVDIGTLGGFESWAAAVNDQGQVAGSAQTASSERHAISWTAAGGLVDLGTLGGPTSDAVDINENGQIAGSAQIDEATEHAALWTVASGPTLSVAVAGGGAGTITGPGISCRAKCSNAYSAGTVVTLTAAADAGSAFVGWDGGGCSGTGSCRITITHDVSVTAIIRGPALAVSVDGDGAGTVTGLGISCPPTCEASFAPGTIVDLRASPSSGSVFDGWGFACQGLSDACRVTIGDSNSVQTVRASFARSGPRWTLAPPDGSVAFADASGSVSVEFRAHGPAVEGPVTITATAQAPIICDTSNSVGQQPNIICTGRLGLGQHPLIRADATSAAGHAGARTVRATFGTYVAMGDSYSAGESVLPFLTPTASGDDYCHRSSWAYGPQLARSPNFPFAFDQYTHFVACSGATTKDLIDGRYREPSQLRILSQLRSHGATVALVTLTIGGNDINFAGVLSHCVQSLMPCAGDQVVKDARRQLEPCKSSSCEPRFAGPEANPLPVATAAQCANPHVNSNVSLRTVLAIIHVCAPYARILILGYPRLFPDPPIRANQHQSPVPNPGLPVLLGPQCAHIAYVDQFSFNSDTRRLDAVIQAAAEDEGAEYVPVYDALKGHELCSGNEEWMNGLALRTGLEASCDPENTLRGLGCFDFSFHPKLHGQRAFAAATEREFASGRGGRYATVLPGRSTSSHVRVARGSASLNVTASWPGSRIVMTLRAPDGRVVTPHTKSRRVSYSQHGLLERYTILRPAPGRWKVKLYGADVAQQGEPVRLVTSARPRSPAPPSAAFRQIVRRHGKFIVARFVARGRAKHYLWSFGDGRNASGPRVTHLYRRRGAFTPELVAIDMHSLASSRRGRRIVVGHKR
jgi:probable HAF family extracellular repeat protein